MLALLVALGGAPPSRAAAAVVGDFGGCAPYLALDEKIKLARNGMLTIPPLPSWPMPADPTWREDPFGDAAWLVRYQSLRYIEHSIRRWCRGGDQAELNRAHFLITDWLADNPQGAAGRYAWYDHSVAWRTFVLINAVGVMPAEAWLRPAIDVHGTWLAEHSGGVGNHALNTNRGLLAAGCFAGRQDWIDLAVSNINLLLRVSVDAQGVTNEQAVGYQAYNYKIYNEARQELLACGQPESTYFQRIKLMPRMLAHATLPNGEYVMLGNTPRRLADVIPGTWAEFAATKGASGPKPGSTDAVFDRGFAFVRSGWGEKRPFRDEVMLSVRFGAGRSFHGHDDGGAVTLYGLGKRLLLDSGKNSFQGAKPWTPFFIGRSAHNVVTVDGLAYARATATTMQTSGGSRYRMFQLGNAGYSGVSNVRSVLYSRNRRYVIVEDRLSSSTYRTYRQLWHLAEDANPDVRTGRVVTRDEGSNVQVIQLLGGAARIRTGSADPRQGWLTYDYQKVIAAPTIEVAKSGFSVRYITVLLPFRDSVAARGDVLALYSDGYMVDVTIDGKTERWTVHGTNVTVRDVTPGPGPGPTPV